MADSSFVSEFHNDDARSSGESSESFTFSTTMNLRKNLASTFDKHVSKTSTTSAVSGARNHVPKHVTSQSNSISAKIAHFEAASNKGNPPTMPQQPRNAIPSNRLAVFLRIRPPSQNRSGNDSSQTPSNTIEVVPPKETTKNPTTVRTYAPAKSPSAQQSIFARNKNESAAKEFDFHQVFSPETKQHSVYSATTAPLLDSLFNDLQSQKLHATQEPLSALLFSYGITNAGKTHTILGDMKPTDESKWGILPRAISDMFRRMKVVESGTSKLELTMSSFEIYNEQIHDLLSEKKREIAPQSGLSMLRGQEGKGQSLIRGLTAHRINDINGGISLATRATVSRHTSSNKLNKVSSRSHCIFQLQLVANDQSPATDGNPSTNKVVSCLWIVDLAGSERSKRTGMVSGRQKEAAHINKSLMTLKRCLSGMREGIKSSALIPFRDSKLTHLFMNHLTGRSAARTAMIVNVNPSIADFDETQHVLAYSSQAKLIRMDANLLSRKRKQYFGDEYGADGRKKAKQPTKGVIGNNLLKKLPPSSRFIAKSKSTENILSHQGAMVDVVHDPGRGIKRRRVEEDASTNSIALTLRSELDIAKKHIKILEDEKAQLSEELNEQESSIRLEVAGEVEERLRLARERHNLELARARAQVTVNTTGLNTHGKMQLERAEKNLEELMDKVNECEEEMIRMRAAHSDEISTLKRHHQLELSALQTSVKKLSEKTVRFAESDSGENMDDLRRQLHEAMREIKELKASKMQVVQNYEKLLHESNDASEGEGDEDEEEEGIPLWKQKLMRAKSGGSGRKALAVMSPNIKAGPRTRARAKNENLPGPRLQNGRGGVLRAL